MALSDSGLSTSAPPAPVPAGRWPVLLRVGPDGHQATVILEGEFDIGYATEAWGQIEHLIDGGHTDITFDLSRVTFVDSRGLSVLVRTWQRVRDEGCVLVTGASPHVRHVFEVAGLERVIDLR